MKNSFWLFGSHHCIITDPHNIDLNYDQVEKRSKPGVKTPPHIYGGYTELIYVIEGQMTVHTKEESIILNSGQHFFIPKGMPPSNNNSSLLIGSWLAVSEHDRFYTTTANTLVKDSIYNISAKKHAWTNIFNKNGTYYDVDYYEMPVLDTIITAHYSVSNQIINYTYDKNGVIGQYTILKISDANLTLEQTFEIVPTPGETQGLPPGTYKCVADTYYTKQ